VAQNEAIKLALPKTLGDYLNANKASFLSVIPRHVDGERMLRVALSCVSRSEKLQSCTLPSVLRSVMQSSILGLELDVNGEAYLVPFKGQAQLIVGYKGMIKLARQSKEIESVHSGFVIEGDEFDFDDGTEAYVRHKKRLRTAGDLQALYNKQEDPSHQAIAWYAAARMRGARYPQVKVLDQYDVEKIHRMSKSANNGPWVQHYDEMGVKTAIRAAAKTWPLSSNLSRVLAAEERTEREGTVGTDDLFPEMKGLIDAGAIEAEGGTVEKPKSGVDTLEQKLNAGKQREPGEEG
jgi:recombination protein RecT